MTQPTVETSDTFEDWRVKTNQISANVGDPINLDASITAADIVTAINNLKLKSTGTSISMAIALG